MATLSSQSAAPQSNAPRELCSCGLRPLTSRPQSVSPKVGNAFFMNREWDDFLIRSGRVHPDLEGEVRLQRRAGPRNAVLAQGEHRKFHTPGCMSQEITTYVSVGVSAWLGQGRTRPGKLHPFSGRMVGGGQSALRASLSVPRQVFPQVSHSFFSFQRQ